ncbi:hypothetical protein Anas_00698 [Armadillidium nasatum]|uniref:Uncharacterized protein n=1 Tax=Armadillidium nasatum TaxID=96803 RepID=A0A5N5SQ16_9CRUS|nr:hypothetical protein Anas_00698 [Armadillidium nasatum]
MIRIEGFDEFVQINEPNPLEELPLEKKTLTPKKEAQEEARLRIELENKFDKKNLPDVCSLSDEAQPLDCPEKRDESKKINGNSRNAVNVLKEREQNNSVDTFQVDNKFLEAVSDAGERITVFDANESPNEVGPDSLLCSVSSAEQKVELATSSEDAETPTPPVPPPRSSSASVGVGATGRDGGGSKIDIHVTVTLNPFAPGTLADLKKQRALSRGAQNSFTLSSGSSVFSLNACQDLTEANSTVSTPSLTETQPSNCNLSVPFPNNQPSPTVTPKRFCGQPSDVIGKRDKLPCCSLM